MMTRMIVAVGMVSMTMLFAATSVRSQESAPTSPPALSSVATATSAVVSAAQPPAPKQEARTAYVVIKTGQWSLQSDSLSNENTRSYGEIAFGGKFNPFLGAEFSVGRFEADATYRSTTANVRTTPVLLSLRLGIPIAVVEPYFLLGGGAYFTSIDVGSHSTSAVKAGYHVGLGVDINLGALLLGVESRCFSTTGQNYDSDVSLDGYLYAAKVGIRF